MNIIRRVAKSIQYHFRKKIADPFWLWCNLYRTQIITGADHTHYKTLEQWLVNMHNKIGKYNGLQIIVWDLGLSKNERNELESRFSKFCEFKTFDYSKHPPWFNISINAGEYAWKPAIIKASLDIRSRRAKYLIWLDSGHLITDLDEFSLIFSLLNNRLIYSPPSSGNIHDWTHPKTLEYLKVDTWNIDLNELRNRSGGLLAFKTTNPNVKKLITNFSSLAHIKECIAPTGSSRENHRQDQAVYTLLYYQFINKYVGQLPTINSERYLGITGHNDID